LLDGEVVRRRPTGIGPGQEGHEMSGTSLRGGARRVHPLVWIGVLAVVFGSLGGMTATEALGPPLRPTRPTVFYPLHPQRVIDTRAAIGAPVGPLSGLTWSATSTGLVPVDVAAVVMNVTVVEPTEDGYLSVEPEGFAHEVSHVNFTRGQINMNQVTVPVGPGGAIVFAFSSGQGQILVDLAGYFGPPTAGGLFSSSSGPPAELTWESGLASTVTALPLSGIGSVSGIEGESPTRPAPPAPLDVAQMVAADTVVTSVTASFIATAPLTGPAVLSVGLWTAEPGSASATALTGCNMQIASLQVGEAATCAEHGLDVQLHGRTLAFVTFRLAEASGSGTLSGYMSAGVATR
jgi:hypothetical protein